MALPIWSQNQGRYDPGINLRAERLSTTLSGRIQDWGNKDMIGIGVQFTEIGSTLVLYQTTTDTDGKFQQVVTLNTKGYRVTPFKKDYTFMPAFFDAIDTVSAIWFHGTYHGKG